ncbi:unnamed protein product [Effrenium voratum]|uniref:Uncharacterized protein n=1 Tax=Effrenium voratum TaxID=2562239 RepID=A0AA36NCV0_9DINO|nr:unnamed protein product [Effrenium voratum]CAJ1437962.1 unnamed protein product [Effrenium voratum]
MGAVSAYCRDNALIAAACSVEAKAVDSNAPGPRVNRAKAHGVSPDPENFLGQHVRNFQHTLHQGGSPAASPRLPWNREIEAPAEPGPAAELLTAARLCDGPALAAALLARADVNCRTLRGNTPLMLAASAQKHSVDMVRELLEAGAEMESVDEKGCTALMHGCGNGNTAAVDLLLDRKASLQGRDRDGKTCLMLAFVGTEDIALIRHLVHRGASIDDKDMAGWSLLFYACEHQNLRLIRWLWSKFHVDLEDAALDGLTPAEMLRRQGFGQPHRWLGPLKRPEMDYLLIDLGLKREDGSLSPRWEQEGLRASLEGLPGLGSRRSSKEQGSRRSSKGLAEPRERKGSKNSRTSSRRSSKGDPLAELPEDAPAAVVTMHVGKDGQQTRGVFIHDPAGANEPGLHDEQEVISQFMASGYSVV